MHDILIHTIKGLVQVRDATPGWGNGKSMAELPVLADSYLAINDGYIADYGSMTQLSSLSAIEVIDASGGFVFTSCGDPHAHRVFAASREAELVMQIKGATYADIAARGGG